MPRPLVFLVLLAHAAALSAQTAPTPPALTRAETGSCARCTLRLEYVATVGSADDKELITEPVFDLLALRNGGFLAWRGGPLLLFDRSGRYLRTVGKIGDGPGESRTIHAAANARGDSVVLYSLGRITTISISTGRGRTEQSLTKQFAFRVAVLSDGNVLAQHYAGAPGAFIVMAPDAELLTTFGPLAEKVRFPTGSMGEDFNSQQFAIAPSAAGGFWAAQVNYAPSLQRWSQRGEVLQSITHKPRWFTPYSYEATMGTSSHTVGVTRPFPKVLGLWADGKDQLFLMASVADANWRRDPNAPGSGARSEGKRAPAGEPTGGYSRYIDGIIDVYDGQSGTLLGSWRADEWPGMPIGEGMIAHRIQSEDGIYSFHVWRMVLSRP